MPAVHMMRRPGEGLAGVELLSHLPRAVSRPEPPEADGRVGSICGQANATGHPACLDAGRGRRPSIPSGQHVPKMAETGFLFEQPGVAVCK